MSTNTELLQGTLVNFSRVDTGFDREHLHVVRVDPQGTIYENERLRTLQREMLAALRALPGVQRATLSTSTPFIGNIDGRRLTIPGVEPRDLDDMTIQVSAYGDGWSHAGDFVPVAGSIPTLKWAFGSLIRSQQTLALNQQMPPKKIKVLLYNSTFTFFGTVG